MIHAVLYDLEYTAWESSMVRRRLAAGARALIARGAHNLFDLFAGVPA